MPAGELPTSVLELRARHSIPNDGTPRPKSTVGLVLDHVKVVMVVPGGPVDRLPERADGLRIEHLDTVLAIDPDGNSGLKPVTSSNVISLLRGDDTVGSLVKLLIKKSTEKLPIEFMLTRADYREVDKMKEVYLKLAELNTAAKANEIVREVDMQIVRDLENRIGDLNDWTRLLEFTLREHVSDLERSVESAHSLLESERTRWSAQEKQQQANFDQAVADARGKYQELQAEFDNFRMSAENTAANQNDMKQAEVDKLLAELSDDVCSRDAQISELKEENVCLTAARDELAVALAESKDKEQQLTEQMQKLNVSVDSLSNSLRDRCESQCSMLQGAKDELACTSAELAASREQVHQLTEEIAALNKTRCDQSKTDADVLMLQAAKEHVSELTAELACTKDLVRQLLECLQGALSDTSGKAEAGGSKPADEVLEMGALNRKLWIQDHQIRQLQHLLCPRACDHDGSFHAKMFAPRMCGVGLMIAKVCNRD